MQGPLQSYVGRPVSGPAAFFFLALFFGLGVSPAAYAGDITIASPVSGTTVPSPAWIRAHNVGCNGEKPTAFGYSLDGSSALVKGVTINDIDTTAALSAGKHTIYYKSWVASGVCPMVSTSFTVSGSSGGSGSSGSGSSGSSSGSGISVTSPANGAGGLSSPLWVRAHSDGCNGKAPTSFDYSIDNNATLYPGKTTTDIDTTGVSIGGGTHTIHFKAWTGGGICPVASTTFTVGGSSSGGSSSGGSSGSGSSGGSGNAVTSLPSYAKPTADLDGAGWSAEHDTGTPGWSKGSMVYPATTPSYDDAREFYMTYSSGAGERFHVSFGNNPSATHFVLDTYVYVVNPSQLQNLELDLNQVMSNGKTVMFDTQCSSDSKTWEYTVVVNNFGHWTPSNVPCNTLTWAAKTWHHIQIGMHRDGNGVITHDWVNFDNTHSLFSNTTHAGTESLGWQPGTLLTNVQLDGLSKGSGSVTVYIHKMTFYSW